MALHLPLQRKTLITSEEICDPLIDITLVYKGFELSVRAKLDTGADYSYFDPDVAENLDIDLEQGQKKVFSQTTGGAFHGYEHVVGIVIDDGNENETVKCRIIFGENSIKENLIGRLDFFKAFRVTIDDFGTLISLERMAKTEFDEDEQPGTW